MKKKAVVLVSGGIDSTVCLAEAVHEWGAENVLALSINYGQKHVKETESSKAVCAYYGVERFEANLSAAFELSDCPLLQKSSQDIIHESYADQLSKRPGTVDTYVPFRNGLMLSYASAIAISVGAEYVFYGAHADDAAGRAYPDCTQEFRSAMNEAMYEGSGGQLNLITPLISFTKKQVVGYGIELEAPLELTWSCYEGQDTPCGTCGTCIDRKVAFEANNLDDPFDAKAIWAMTQKGDI